MERIYERHVLGPGNGADVTTQFLGQRFGWRVPGSKDAIAVDGLGQSKTHPGLKRNFEAFSACDWLATLTAHIPNAGEHLVRYYGWYSNVNRGKRRKAQGGESTTIEEFSTVSNAAAKPAWAHRSAELVEASSSRSTKSIRTCVPAALDPCASSPFG